MNRMHGACGVYGAGQEEPHLLEPYDRSGSKVRRVEPWIAVEPAPRIAVTGADLPLALTEMAESDEMLFAE